jgi:hypothetical protein
MVETISCSCSSKRCEGKLREELLKLKEKENEQEATHIEDAQRLVTERLKC